MGFDFDALKERVRIPEVWRWLGLAGEAGTSCRCPWREDKSPSFSVYDDGRRWKDHATGEGGDVMDFIARACGLGLREAARRLIVIAGGAPPTFASRGAVVRSAASAAPIAALEMPPLLGNGLAEWREIGAVRGLDCEAAGFAYLLGTLKIAEVAGRRCWVITDDARRVAEARRMDGQPFSSGNKAHTLKGSIKSWPVGVEVLHSNPAFAAVMLVEGTPDYLAALHFAHRLQRWDVLPVAMLGRATGQQIHPEALDLLAGRRVRICPHKDADGGGRVAAQKWGEQLHSKRCQLDIFTLDDDLRQADGSPVKDLNDAARVPASLQNRLADLIP